MSEHRLTAHGIDARIPGGWDGRIFKRRDGGPLTAPAPGAPVAPAAPASGITYPIVHLANFPLPEGLGDYMSGASESMRPGDVIMALLEDSPEAARTPLFRRSGIPRLRPSDFSPWRMHRPLPGMTGTQRFFHVGDRAFVLYVALGSADDVRRLLPTLNGILEQLVLD